MITVRARYPGMDGPSKSTLPVAPGKGRATKSAKATTSKSAGSSNQSLTLNSRGEGDALPEQLPRLGNRPEHPQPKSFSAKKTVNISPINRQIARISSQNAGPSNLPTNANASSSSTTRTSDMMQRKSGKVLPPIWRRLDDEVELERKRSSKRNREGNSLLANRRSAIARRPAAATNKTIRISVDDPNRSPALIAPTLRLTVGGQIIVDSEDDEPRYRPQPNLKHRKAPGSQVAIKKSAARKVEYIDTDSDSDESDEQMKTASEMSSEDSDVDQLDSDQYDPQLRKTVRAGEHEDEDDNIVTTRRELDPRPSPILILDSPPIITAPLPRHEVVEEQKPTISNEPSEALLLAFEAISLSTIRLHNTRQLPFLMRDLRRGFINRCRELHVPIYPDNSEIDLQIFYEFIGGHVYRTEVDKWRCPMCDLLGNIRTREMLDCHLKWDHPEIYYEWQYMEYSETNSWILQVVIPEVQEADAETTPHFDRQAAQGIADDDEHEQHERAITPTPRRLSKTPFSMASRSPSTESRSTPEALVSPYRTKVEQIHIPGFRKVEPFAIDLSRSPSRGPSMVPSTSRSQSAASSSNTISTATTSSRRLRPLDTRYPTPPPPDNPLGPAAQYPYLPAESDYGGPTILYSCRPNGPCLFDLLGTLPMEIYGLLDWEVLDREDEIYESDDIKEEYKIMHALWARWIFLNRNKFIDNHLKGVQSFIDDFWKMIHRAAGWDALRYFLFILLANRYLTGREIAVILRYYENHTGMEFWYE